MPSSVQKAAQAAAKSGQVDMMTGYAPNDSAPKPTLKNTTPPAIFVATSPTELMVTKGPPSYVAIPGTDLLYVSNTKADVFQEITTGHIFVLISGRWFTAPTTAGPWTFVPPNELPVDFAHIPFDSPKENVLASIPGTPQAAGGGDREPGPADGHRLPGLGDLCDAVLRWRRAPARADHRHAAAVRSQLTGARSSR